MSLAFSFSINKVSFKKNRMSLGLVVLEKLFTRTQTRTPQSDDIKNENRTIVKLAKNNTGKTSFYGR